MNRKLIIICLLLALFASVSAISNEKPEPVASHESRVTEVMRQFGIQSTLENGAPFDITIVASESLEGEALAACAAASSRALNFFSELFSENGIETKINSLRKGESVKLSPEVYNFISRALELSSLANGLFDIAVPTPKKTFARNGWRQFTLDKTERTLSVGIDGVRVDLLNIAYGWIVDIAMEEITVRGFENAKVDTGSAVSKNMGRDIHTPWNVEISLAAPNHTAPGERLAHHAFMHNVSSVAAARITPEGLGKKLIDAHSKKPVSPKTIKSVTVFADSASLAAAYGVAAYTLGVKNGMKFIEARPEVQGIIVDSKGALFMSKDLAGKVRDVKSN